MYKALELSAKGVNQRLTKEVISTYPLETAGGIQQVLFVNEDGLYDVVLDSRKPQAKTYRKWITSEVLPAIRKAINDHVDADDVTKRYAGVVTGKKSDGSDAIQNRLMTYVTESGLFALIFGSK